MNLVYEIFRGAIAVELAVCSVLIWMLGLKADPIRPFRNRQLPPDLIAADNRWTRLVNAHER